MCERSGRRPRVDTSQSHVGRIPLGNNKGSLLTTYRVPLTCHCKGAVWATGFGGHLLFRHRFCGTLTSARLSPKKTLQVNLEIRNLTRGWRLSSTSFRNLSFDLGK